jgi:hypothetical protein
VAITVKGGTKGVWTLFKNWILKALKNRKRNTIIWIVNDQTLMKIDNVSKVLKER